MKLYGILLFTILFHQTVHAFPVKRSILRIYSGDDGQSHIEHMDLDFEAFRDKEGAYGEATLPMPARSLAFRTGKAGYKLVYHCAPRRQMIIMLGGTVEILVGDGTTAQATTGDCILAEDLTGQGHVTRVVGEEERFYAIVPLQNDNADEHS